MFTMCAAAAPYGAFMGPSPLDLEGVCYVHPFGFGGDVCCRRHWST